MDLRLGDRGAVDDEQSLSGGGVEPTNGRVSDLDESRAFGERWTCRRALNASLTLSRGEGTTEEFTDLSSSYGAVNFGHCNEDICLPAHPRSDLVAGVYPPEAERFARWLTDALGVSGFKVLFQVGGSFAVSAALALAQRRRPGQILAIKGGFHGLGLDSLSVTTAQRSFALQETPLRQSLDSFVDVLAPGETGIDWSGVSCLIFEPIQGARGYVPLDAHWLQDLCAQAKNAGVTVIADEIQCGYYRFGDFSVAKKWGLNPDVLLFSKSMTNGLYPFSAVVYRQTLEVGIGEGVVLAHTFQTSALGCYAACAVADYIDTHDVKADCRRVAVPLAEAAARIAESGRAREIYQIGPSLSFRPVINAGDLVKACFADRVLILGGGMDGERIRIAPPLTIETEALRRALEILLSRLSA
ncbi:MAG: aminotransferase class III-fold pyridoxal phosphate-dependent enzyme [Proteobacteria bacterium]|nr:aminotransferase class III-fold pyridoxal phosphate-dependent enzyme [Pseudomonadota bacterium]